MILQDKAKEDFLKWYFKAHHRSLNYSVIKESETEMFFKSLHKVFQTALITEWLDSVGIYIHIKLTKTNKGIKFQACINKGYLTHEILWSYFNSRQETTKVAIEKANEIYNTQHFAQDEIYKL